MPTILSRIKQPGAAAAAAPARPPGALVTLLYLDDCFLNHETGNHPERAERIRLIPARLARAGLDARCRRPAWEPVSGQRLTRVHTARYVQEVWAMAKSGGGESIADTVVGPCSYDVALQAAGAVCDATERLLRGEDRRALCVVRPPGHHAMAGHGMGFCLFNNVAVAARMALDEFQLDRVLVVDWDVHHGNGTQAAFWEEPRVGFLSIHRWPFYPGTGDGDETGGGPAVGTKLNLPVTFGTPRTEYLARFADAPEDFAAKNQTATDPPQRRIRCPSSRPRGQSRPGNRGLPAADEPGARCGRRLCRRPLVSVLEGGYNPQVTADCVGPAPQAMVDRDEVLSS